jgi:hypothetical protein
LFPIQTLVPKATVKAFYKAVLPRAARLDVNRLEHQPKNVSLPLIETFSASGSFADGLCSRVERAASVISSA